MGGTAVDYGEAPVGEDVAPEGTAFAVIQRSACPDQVADGRDSPVSETCCERLHWRDCGIIKDILVWRSDYREAWGPRLMVRAGCDDSVDNLYEINDLLPRDGMRNYLDKYVGCHEKWYRVHRRPCLKSKGLMRR